MKVLLIGYSDIARRRVLPALRAAGVENVDIASVSTVALESPGTNPSRRFRAYETALAETDADLVYISTVNSLHYKLAQMALERGLHVVIDKPACLGLEETLHIVELATRHQRCVAEATVYMYHPRIAKALEAFEEIGSRPTHLVATFSSPPRREDNFRYQAALGGGAMWDLGPYAITPGRVFFGAPASEIVSRELSTHGKVDTGFSLLVTYPGGRTEIGVFGFTTEYVNRLDILGPGVAVTMDRAFSPLPNVPTSLMIRRADRTVTTTISGADTFALFFKDVLSAITLNDYRRFADLMVSDAKEMHRLRGSASGAQESAP